MTVKEFYEQIGGNYQDAIALFVSDAVILKFLKKFEKEETYQSMMKALEEQNLNEAFKAAHTLKGVAGNLRFTMLYNELVELVEQLRPLTEMPEEHAIMQVKERYQLIIEKIGQLEE